MAASYAVDRHTRRRAGATRRFAAAVWQHRHDPRWRGMAVSALLLVASVAAFGHLVEDYLTGDPIVRWDVEFARWLHEHSSSSLVSVFDIVTLAGNVAFLAGITAVVILLLLRRRAVGEAALLAIVALGIEILNGALKLAFHRPRPELAFVHLDTYSFPSGHAAGSAAIYGALAYLAARRLVGARRVAVVVAAPLLVGLVGFSRLYLGAHYLSDVLAGFSIGASWLFAWVLLSQIYGERLLPANVRGAVDRLTARLQR
jgi:membrane-associated phospholipid phosphatase